MTSYMRLLMAYTHHTRVCNYYCCLYYCHFVISALKLQLHVDIIFIILSLWESMAKMSVAMYRLVGINMKVSLWALACILLRKHHALWHNKIC